MRRILAGVETEYGLLVEGHGAEDQIDDAMALVRGYPGECLAIWDYRHESPRADLRGFQLERLAVDPIDAAFDRERPHGETQDVRSDRILPNGARFYNDHGHPEYATPECWSLRELAIQDRYGESVVLNAARAMSERTGLVVQMYKNNTDFHGASYGTHESYLVPRSVPFDTLFESITPILVARQILTGAGKVGSESGAWCDYQISQRADFFMEPVNAETLYRRPVFNTRDEAHADPAQWIRLHVISGDANMMPECTARKVGLVKLALLLALDGHAPKWTLADPVDAFKVISRDRNLEFKVALAGRNWTNAYEILESYFAAAEDLLSLDEEMRDLIADCREILRNLHLVGRARRSEIPTGTADQAWSEVRRRVDWAAKEGVIQTFVDEGGSWKDPLARAYDLEYHNVDPAEGLYHALEEMHDVDVPFNQEEIEKRAEGHPEGTRAWVRGMVIQKFRQEIRAACWRSVTFQVADRLVEVDLKPDLAYERHLMDIDDVETLVRMLRGDS